MYQLLYISNAVNLMSNDELESLLGNARIKNHQLNITGMLVYLDGSFIQVLEGEKAVVKDSFKNISKDPRHNNIILVDENHMVVFKNLCHSININAQALRSDRLCPTHLISMKPLKTYRQEKI